MQFYKDKTGEYLDIFFKLRQIVLSFDNITEKKILSKLPTTTSMVQFVLFVQIKLQIKHIVCHLQKDTNLWTNFQTYKAVEKSQGI